MKTGETVKQARLQYWVEELGQWISKEDIHTFYPNRWSYRRIEKAVLEATENIIDFRGNKFVGETTDSIKIEFYIDKNTNEIKTAYIIMK